MTGPNLRGSGVARDLRKDEPYSGYENYDFQVCLGEGQYGPLGSCFDRNWVRVVEMRESSKILHQALDRLEKMEKTDVHEKVPKRVKPPKGEIYFRSEAPRGQLGYYLVSDGNVNPYRVKVKSPCFTAMSAFHHLARGMMIADIIRAIVVVSIPVVVSVGIWYNCASQHLVQRCLAAKDEWHARVGVVTCGSLRPDIRASAPARGAGRRGRRRPSCRARWRSPRWRVRRRTSE